MGPAWLSPGGAGYLETSVKQGGGCPKSTLSSELVLCVLSHVRLFVAPWTVARQAPLSIGFSRQEYCSGLLFPSAGDLLHPGIKPTSPGAPALAGGFFTTSATWEAHSELVLGYRKSPKTSFTPYWCPPTPHMSGSSSISALSLHWSLCVGIVSLSISPAGLQVSPRSRSETTSSLQYILGT